MSHKLFTARRFEASPGETPEAPEGFDREERVVVEEALEVRVNGKPFTVTLRMPGADRELIQGLLFSEGLLEVPDDLLALEEKPGKDDATTWEATLKPRAALDSKLSNRSLASTSSCGFCGKMSWEESAPETQTSEDGGGASARDTLSPGFLETCFAAMQARQGVFAATGGSHAAAVFSAAGELLAMGEDVGRHNAVDKAIGILWAAGRLGEGLVLCVSGRVSYEIVSKTSRAGFPVLAAVSAPSSLAVEYCRDSGITLAAFCRGPRATIYSHPERVRAPSGDAGARAPALEKTA